LTQHPNLRIAPRLIAGGRLAARCSMASIEDEIMSRVCELTGKGTQVGHNVSHANNKTKRRWLPNLQNVTFMSEALGTSHTFRVSTNGARSVEHVGGIDKWLLKTGNEALSIKAQRLKRLVAKKLTESAAA
jgi:large subunit ribosomal protein L28